MLRRYVEAIIILIVLCLSWYGAEVLLYGYSQTSIVDGVIAVCIAMSISGRMEKERIINEHKREFAEGLLKGLQKGIAERKQDGENAGDRGENPR